MRRHLIIRTKIENTLSFKQPFKATHDCVHKCLNVAVVKQVFIDQGSITK